MARIGSSKQISRPILNKLLGINQNTTGDTGLLYGESGDMENVVITDKFKISRVDGYKELFPALGTSTDRAFAGTLKGIERCIIANDGTFYNVDKSTGALTDIGNYTGTLYSFFTFNDILYAMSDTEYYKWTGTGNFTIVVGYIPLYRANMTPATGVGDNQEEFNILSNSKHCTYNADGTATYQLPETNINSVGVITVDGINETNFTVNNSTGIITFTAGHEPSVGQNNVDIVWVKDNGGRAEFIGNRYAIDFGKENDTRIFIWGDSDNKHRIRFSDLADGLPSAEYFPADQYTDIANSGIYIKDLMKYQGNLMIFKSDELHSGTIEYVTETTSGNTKLVLTTIPLTKVKTIPFNRGQMVNGIPVQVGEQLYRVTETYIKEERNVKPFSNRIRYGLEGSDLSKAITFDVEKDRQYWIAIDNIVWIYSYETDTFSKLRLNDNITCINVSEGELYFSTDKGEVMKFDKSLVTFNGSDLDWHWHMNFEDYDADYRRKSLKRLHITVDPTEDQYMEVNTVTDKDGLSSIARVIDISHMTFINMNFANFSFNTSYLPKPTRLKMNSKKFTYISIRLSGGFKAKPLTLINMTPKIVYGGESK